MGSKNTNKSSNNTDKPIMGRPRKITTKRLIENMKKQGAVNTFEILMGVPFITSETIADFLGVSKETLVRWIKRTYGKTFDDLKAEKMEGLKLKLAGKQFEVAFQGDKTMLIWLGKQYLGQTEKQELTGKDQGPIAIKQEYDLDSLSIEELEQLSYLQGKITKKA